MQAILERADRFLEQELDLKERALVVVAALLLCAVYLFPLWNLTMFAPQYPDGLRMNIYSYKLEGGQPRAGRQGDQPAEPLHRHEGPGRRGLHRVQVDAVRRRRDRPALPARGRARPDGVSRRRHRAVRLLRGLLALVVRLQAVQLRPQSRADGGGEGAAVHAADVRLQEARELRGLLVPGRRLVRAGRRHRCCCS